MKDSTSIYEVSGTTYNPTCGKCGKPYIYIGDWFGEGSPTCQCPSVTSGASSNWVYVYPPRQGWQCPKCKMVHSPDVKMCMCQEICSLCGNAHEYTITAPYGSEHDGDVICVECLDKLIRRKKK